MGGSAAVGAGAAGFALVGCGNDDDDDDVAPPPPDDDDDDTDPVDDPTPTPSDEPQQGGVRRLSSADATFDTFDADRSRFTPFAAILGYTHLGIVQYRRFADGGELEGALAEGWEQVDDQTLVFTLREGVRWHDKPPLNGRETTVEDLQFFIERNRAGTTLDGEEDASFHRQAEYQAIESVETTDERTLTVRFARPYPFLLGTLAGSYAKVQAPEIIEEFEGRFRDLPVEAMVGTGSYMMDSFEPEGRASFIRNPDFYDPPILFDGIQYVPLFVDTAARQTSFLQKDIDELGGLDMDTLQDLLDRHQGEIFNTPSFSANPMAGTYYGGAPPWDDPRLIGAIFRTFDRRLLMEHTVQGSAALSGNVPPTQVGWGIPETELITLPGYLEDREEDLAEARAMWEAAGGPELGTVTVDIPDIWEGLYSGVAETVTSMLSNNLGNTFQANIEPYTTINGKIFNQAYGSGNANIWYGWISDVQSLEPTLGLWAAYNSGAPAFPQFGVQSDDIDNLTNAAMVEFDVDRRIELSQDIERALLANWGAGIPHNILGISNTLRWNYYNLGESAPFANTHNIYRDHWFDQTDPTWEGRP